MARVVFLNRFYWPEEPATAQLLTDLAEALAAAGREVVVITSRPGGSDFPRREQQRGVTILRVAATRLGHRGLPGKAADFVTFYLGALWQLCQEGVRHNLWAVATALGSEAAVIAACLLKFGTYPAAHTWGAKFYGLCLLGCLIALLAFDAGSSAFISLALVAAATNGEILLMHLIAKTPPVDVRSILSLSENSEG